MSDNIRQISDKYQTNIIIIEAQIETPCGVARRFLVVLFQKQLANFAFERGGGLGDGARPVMKLFPDTF